jgi:hypothetical protein
VGESSYSFWCDIIGAMTSATAAWQFLPSKLWQQTNGRKQRPCLHRRLPLLLRTFLITIGCLRHRTHKGDPIWRASTQGAALLAGALLSRSLFRDPCCKRQKACSGRLLHAPSEDHDERRIELLTDSQFTPWRPANRAREPHLASNPMSS